MSPSSRGFTLAELAVTIAVGGLAVTLAVGTMVANERSLRGQEETRKAQVALRQATSVLERTVRRAGFGVDPPQAFDFTLYPAQPCSVAPCARDSVTAPDRLVFYTRNPFYSLNGSTLTGKVWTYQGNSGGLQLTARQGDRFVLGQELLVLCSGGSDAAYVEVATTTPSTPATSDGTITVPLKAVTTQDAFHQQGKLAAASNCFQAGAGTSTLVFQVDRYHFLVNSYASATGGQVPWLVLDRGLDDNLDGQLDTRDFLPIAENVEDLQVGYLMNASATAVAPDSDRNWLYGDTVGTAEVPLATAPAPAYSDGTLATVRYGANPANVRAVRLELAVRVPVPQGGRSEAAPALLNRTTTSLPATGAYRRLTSSIVVSTMNLQSRARFRF